MAAPTKVLSKTKMCRFFATGECTRGEACNFAHCQSDLQTRPNLAKTNLCMAFERNGYCREGSACKYAHGVEELRHPEPSNLKAAKSVGPVEADSSSATSGLSKFNLYLPRSEVGDSQMTLHMPTPVMGSSPVMTMDTIAYQSTACSTSSDDAFQDGENSSTPSLSVDFFPGTDASTSLEDEPSGQDSMCQNCDKVTLVPLVADLRKTKMCRFFVQGICNKGEDCSFAHKESSLRAQPNFHRTRLCMAFEQNGSCPNRETCRYAHGFEELRSKSDDDHRQNKVEGSFSPEDPIYLTFAMGRVWFR